ncbi:MAG: hypothetical protein A4E66_00034 [Syntrophus sp. PtaB.Bin001]|nr:MAG: hypothetical protein A4E66_00034 [Syntrophus sp. PtaB.Bin001]
MAAKMIDAKQIQLMHIARTQLGLSEDDYRLILGAQTKGKKNSSKELTYFEADSVINYFVKTLGFKIKSNYIKTGGTARRTRWQRSKSGNVVLLPSRDQLEMIDVLVKKIAWKVEDGFSKWLKKYMKIDRIKTADEASNAIEGLKGLLEHQEKRP